MIVNRPDVLDLINGDSVAPAALDQSHDLIVVLDDDGTIVLTNAAWRTGVDRRGAADAVAGCGVNYLEVCERSDAAVVAAGVRAVLRGDLPRFEIDYPCHSPAEDAWFALEVLALGEPGSGVVLTHTNVTARVAAARRHRHGRDVDPVTMLATSPAGVTGLTRMLADAQSRRTSLAVVNITVSDLVEIESRHGRRSRDELIVQVVSRVLRHTRADDPMIRVATNQLVLFASVADAQGAEFLRGRISDALEATYLVGADAIEAHASVEVTSSDQFSTLDSLMHGFSRARVRPPQGDSDATPCDDDDAMDDAAIDEIDASYVPLVVYSLPDGFLQTANEAARSLFGLKTPGRDPVHARDIADPIDVRHATAALSALSSGATDSYRAQRTLVTADGPLAMLTSVRRLLVGTGAFAVELTVPVHLEETVTTTAEDPFSAALVAGTIDANGVVVSVSSPSSPMESELVGALSETLRQAAHPDDADLVDKMLESLRRRGSATAALRVRHSEQGWVVSQCQLFTITRHADRDSSTESPVVGYDAYGFVVSANVSTKSMVDKIARLERHIRRIGSEVHAADLDLTVRPSADRDLTDVLDALAPTARQREIVERLARGQRVASIAAELFVSRSTVRNHLAHVYRLAGVHSQDELLNALRAP